MTWKSTVCLSGIPLSPVGASPASQKEEGESSSHTLKSWMRSESHILILVQHHFKLTPSSSRNPVTYQRWMMSGPHPWNTCLHLYLYCILHGGGMGRGKEKSLVNLSQAQNNWRLTLKRNSPWWFCTLSRSSVSRFQRRLHCHNQFKRNFAKIISLLRSPRQLSILNKMLAIFAAATAS